jgi:hypothetical protein
MDTIELIQEWNIRSSEILCHVSSTTAYLQWMVSVPENSGVGARWIPQAATGFLGHYHNVPYWITAAHVLEPVRSQIELGIAKGFRLQDSGPGSPLNHPFPIDVKNRSIIYGNERAGSLDIGMIRLRRIDVENLRKNNKRFVDASDDVLIESFDMFCLVGSPEFGRTADAMLRPDGGVRARFRHEIPLVPLKFVQGATTGRYVFSGFKEAYRSVGSDQGLPETSVKGMSGGPVFGIKFLEDSVDVRVVAVQSAQSDEVDGVRKYHAHALSEFAAGVALVVREHERRYA